MLRRVCLAGAVLASGLAYADDTAMAKTNADLQKEIEHLRQVVLEEQTVIANTMKRIDDLEKTKTTQDKAGINNIKLNGDFRYRYEYIHQDPQANNLTGVRGALRGASEPNSRDRHRLRLRAGIDWTINDEVTVSGRIATTMNADNISYNQTLDDAFAKKDLWLDTAFFDYHPKVVPGLKLLGGKMVNPFYTPGKTQMIWDQDLTPEGLAATYTNTMEKSPTGPIYKQRKLEVGGTLAYFIVDERALDIDGQMLGAQGTLKYNFNDEGTTSLLGGLSYYDFGHVKGFPPLFTATDNFGNSLSRAITSGNALYADDYNLLEGFAEFTIPVWERPLSIYGDVTYNLASLDHSYAPDTGHLAYAAGIQYGRCVAPQTWAVKYEYRFVDRDAVIGAFSDSDWGGGGTNAKGHTLSLEYAPLKNTRLQLSVFANDLMGRDALRLVPVFGGKENVEGPYRRVQLDVNFKF